MARRQTLIDGQHRRQSGAARILQLISICILSVTTGIAAAQLAQEKRLVLSSPAFAPVGVIPDKYTLAVSSPVSPPLVWADPPPDTVSFTLIMHDPDAVQGKSSADIVHWMVFNIPGSARELEEAIPLQSRLPDGSIQAQVRPGRYGYSGAGARIVYHHYTFELFALDTMLDLSPEVTREQLMAAMDGHVIAKAAYVGRFHR